MAKVNLERNAFVRGLITEASALTFPENASIDEDNMILNRDGSRQRRLGMDYENGGVVVDTTKAPLVFDTQAVTTFKWDNINNDPTLSFGVIQIGFDLWFVDLFKDTLSANLKNSSAPFVLNTASIGYTISGNETIDFTSINGQLVIVSKELKTPLYIGYNKAGDDFFVTAVDVMVRDIWGVFDTLDTDDRPKDLKDEHKYNLLNQGWPTANITNVYGDDKAAITLKAKFPKAYDSSGVVITYPAQPFNIDKNESDIIVAIYGTDGNVNYPQAVGDTAFPSNADIVFLGKTSTGSFDTALIKGSFLGSTPAAKGKFVVGAFTRGTDRTASTGIILPVDADTGTLEVVATYANRLFFSGVPSSVSGQTSLSPNYTGTVFFSQTVENVSQLGRCYQESDPTAEDINELVATDGGTIKITGASTILKLIPTATSLVVVAENGIWEITGPDGVFKANDFSINKISNVGAVGAGTVVDAEGSILYWSDGGIYQLVSDQVSGRLSATNISESTIQTLFNTIPSVGTANATSVFDPASRKIQWLYNDTENYDGINLRYKYNRELILDTVLGSFYTNEIQDITTDTPFVSGYLVTQNFNVTDLVQSIVVNGEQVQVNGVDVVATTEVRSRGVSQTKYLAIRPNEFTTNYGFTFSHFAQSGFLDWKTADGSGKDAAAFLVTGFELFQDSQRDKQLPYLTMHFNRTETGFTDIGGGNLEAINESGCLVQVQWDFADSAAGGKFGKKFQAYRLNRLFIPTGTADTFDYGQKVVTTKSKVRGSGKAISIRMESEAGKDLFILGWAMNVGGKERV